MDDVVSPEQAAMLQERHVDYAKALALQIARSLPSHVDRDDLIGFACTGLADAAQSYMPQRGIPFETYSYHRIRGAVFDGISKMSGISAGVRRALAREQAVDSCTEVATQVDPSGSLDTVASTFVETIGRVGMVFVASNAAEIAASRAGEEGDDPAIAAESSEMLELVRRSLETLDPESRELVQALYFEGVSTTEFAQRIGRDKSTVSRRHRTALTQLRRGLEDQTPRSSRISPQ